MGLDMSLYLDSNTSKTTLDPIPHEEIAYWRKHPNLHGFFEQKWNDAGWKGNMNCVDFKLSEEILDEAIFKVIMNALPDTSGFFFGESVFTKERIDDDLKLLKQAKQHINEGKKVYYSANW
jgi:hypothetical protein